MAKYNEIMSRIAVTPEMRERVLSNVEAARAAGQATPDTDSENNSTDFAAFAKKRAEKAAAGRQMNRTLHRFLPVAAAACLVLVIGIGVGNTFKSNEEQPNDAVTSEGLVECASLDELSKSVGFEVPDLTESIPYEVRSTTYSDVFGIARVDYDGDGEQRVELSMGKDDGTDVSGDSNEYASVETADVGGITVTLKGDHGAVSLATWTSGGYAYALSFGPSRDRETVETLVRACGE